MDSNLEITKKHHHFIATNQTSNKLQTLNFSYSGKIHCHEKIGNFFPKPANQVMQKKIDIENSHIFTDYNCSCFDEGKIYKTFKCLLN